MPNVIRLSTANQAGQFAAMRSANALNDVVFVCKEGRRANAHRLALAAVSELAHDLIDRYVDVVSFFLPDFCVESVEKLLDLIYKGECAVDDEDQIQEIIHLISILRLKTPLNCNLNLEKEPKARSPRSKTRVASPREASSDHPSKPPVGSPFGLPVANRKRTLPLEISAEVAKRLVLTPLSPTKSILSSGGRSSGNRVTFHRGAALTNILTIPPRDPSQSTVKRKLDFDPMDEEESIRVTRSASVTKNADGSENAEKEKADSAEGPVKMEIPLGSPEKAKSERKIESPVEKLVKPEKTEKVKSEPGRKIKCLRCSKVISEQSRALGFRKHLALKHYSAVCRRFIEVTMEEAGNDFREFFHCQLCDLATADSSAALLHVACIHRSEFDSHLALDDFTAMHDLAVDVIKTGPTLKLHKVRQGDRSDHVIANHVDHVPSGPGSPVQGGGGTCVICGQTYSHNLKMHLLSHFWRKIVEDYGLKTADGCCPICHCKMSTSGYAFEYHVAFRHKKIFEMLRFNNATKILHDDKD